MFKVGQKVWCTTYGEGVVSYISATVGEIYPVYVELACGIHEYYTEDGKRWNSDDEPSLSVIEG